LTDHSNTFTTKTKDDGGQVIHEELPVSHNVDYVTEEIQDAEEVHMEPVRPVSTTLKITAEVTLTYTYSSILVSCIT